MYAAPAPPKFHSRAITSHASVSKDIVKKNKFQIKLKAFYTKNSFSGAQNNQ